MKFKKFFSNFFILEALIVLLFIAFDQLLKMYSADNLQGESVPLIKGIINLTYHENSGAAFGIFQGKMLFFKVITVIALGAFFYILYKSRGGNLLLRISLSLIISGTVGNFIDRVKLGYVRDMIETKFMDFAIFNIADSCLTVGVILFAIYYLFIYKEPPKKINIAEAEAKTPQEDNTDA